MEPTQNPAPENNGRNKPPAYVVRASIRPKTINVIRLTMHPVEPGPGVTVFDLPYTSGEPRSYLSDVMLAGAVAATYQANRLGCGVGVDFPTMKALAAQVVEAVRKKVETTVLGPDGKRTVETQPDGSILTDEAASNLRLVR